MSKKQSKRDPLVRACLNTGLNLILAGILHSTGWAAGERALIVDAQDMADSSGDVRAVSASIRGEYLYLSMSVQGVAAPAMEQTPENMSNRYYYHWLLDTDNNPATGRSNAEYEGAPTGVKKPVGAERVIQIGWRDGKPNGIQAYDPLDEDTPLLSDFNYQASGNTLTAVLPLGPLGLTPGQTIALSAFQEGASDGWAVDWMESDTLALSGLNPATVLVADPQDMADSSGDIQNIGAYVMGDQIHLTMTMRGTAAPATEQTPENMSNRYYYHWLLDTDNNPATGRSNAEYEGTPTGVKKPVGAERVVQIGWRDGKPNGIQVYDPLDEDTLLVENFSYQVRGNTLTATLPLAGLGLTAGQTIGLSAFQEGASDGWAVDWAESATLTLNGPAVAKAQVLDAKDLGDSSGDIRGIEVQVDGTNLRLSMTVDGVAAPSTEQTPTDKSNRYYYHWLLDTDNNPATGRSNAEYEGTPTGVKKPVGAERVIQIGWRDGKPNGIQAYDPLDEDTLLAADFSYQASGNTLSAEIPLSALGLAVGQTIAVSAFQEGASDSWAVDWMESGTVTLEAPAAGRMKIDGQFQDWASGAVTSVDDPTDMADSSGDIKQIQATTESGYLYLRMTVQGTALPSVEETPEGMSNRYYYHWLLDTDNNPATGRSNAEYEGEPTGVQKPIGAERVIQLGWRDGKTNGVSAYDPLDEDTALVENYEFKASGNSVEARIKLSDLGLSMGQTIAISAFQEGASDGWAVDWIESAVMTLSEAGTGNMTLETQFSGNPYGFEIIVQDQGTNVVDTASVVVREGAQVVETSVSKAGSTNTITGRYAALLPAGTLHTVSLSLRAGGQPMSKDFVYKVEPYSVLPASGRLTTLDKANTGFVVNVTQISSFQTGVPSVHSNLVELAEKQLAGQITNETGDLYINEAEESWESWKITPFIASKVINWFEPAPGMDASLNFPNDEPIPHLSGNPQLTSIEGVVVELLTYLDLAQGYHKLGLYTEGGHKISAGLSPLDPVLSLYDNAGGVERVPSYYARNQFVDVVAPQAGYYPIRILWFQSKRREEIGLMLELFSVQDRVLHLINDASDPKSLPAYHAGILLTPGKPIPTLRIEVQGKNLILQWTGMLQLADSINGPWIDHGDQSQSPLTLPLTGPMKFVRARGN